MTLSRESTVLVDAALADRFYMLVDKREEKECWPWLGSKPTGYGYFRIGAKTFRVHRVAWVLDKRRPIPKKQWVLHTCDNPPCCNPAHLFLGNHKVNMADRHAKGRDTRGQMTRKTHLTEDIVRAIRSEYAAGGVTQDQLADKYGLKRDASICRIINRTRWGWVQ